MKTEPTVKNWDALMNLARDCRSKQMQWARLWAETIPAGAQRKHGASIRRVRKHARSARGWNRALVGIKREFRREAAAAEIIARTQEVVRETTETDYEFCQLSGFAEAFA